MKVPCNAPNRLARLDAMLPPGRNITILHFGRGGVQQDGTLDAYNRSRVEQTLSLASSIALLRPHAQIQIIWMGKYDREQDRAGMKPPATEGGAALQYASKLIETDVFTMLAEEESTSSVENATASAKLVPEDDIVVTVTDPLHYMTRKIQYIMWLVFPKRRIVFVELPASPPGTAPKDRVKHVASTLATVLGMILFRAKRGDAANIQQCQVRLQNLTGH